MACLIAKSQRGKQEVKDMRKIGKVCALVIIGMLIVNLVAAMPIGDSGDMVLKTEQEKTQKTDPTIPDNPEILENPTSTDGPTDSEGPTVYGGPPPPDSTGSGSPPPPPPPTGFDSPIVPKTGVVPLFTIFVEWSDTPTDPLPHIYDIVKGS